MSAYQELKFCFCLIIQATAMAQPWAAPFHSDTKSLLEESQKIQPIEGESIRILIDEYRYSFDKQGRAIETHRQVYRVTAKEAPEDWALVEKDYRPWHQERPALRARVVTPDGSVHTLDQKTLTDSPTIQLDATIFSDGRNLRAPLPAIREGAIVEWETVVREKAPLLDAGVVRRVFLPNHMPMESFRLTIEAPASLPVRVRSHGLPASTLQQTTSKSMSQWKWVVGPMAAKEDWEWDLPPDQADFSYVAFSTGDSWQAVAKRYEELVEQQIKNADLSSLLVGSTLSGEPAQVVQQLVTLLHREVRYTGIEFGESAIIPAQPQEILKRKFGDCKDKATLLVAMLRTAGLRAKVALLSSGSSYDVDPDLPGLGGFDHAIVRVESKPPIWIDATASNNAAGLLPQASQGRWALIAGAETQSLEQTPEGTPADNWERHTVEMEIPDLGPARLWRLSRRVGCRKSD